MIIETNTYSALKKDDPIVVQLIEGEHRLALPLPAVAELKYGFINGARTAFNEAEFEGFLSQSFVSILMPTLRTCGIYAELRFYAQKAGRALSNNDIWIAALTREDGDTLVTYDRDFAVFQELFGSKLVILEA